MFDQTQLELFTQRSLMVVGGFAAGYLLVWLAGVGFDKAVVRKRSPQFLHKWARFIGGVLVALVVAFLVFRGGKGGGDGTGDGDGSGQQNGPTTKQTATTPSTRPREEVTVDTKPVYVTVYAGAAVERGTEKFYAIGNPPGAKVDRERVAEAIRAAGLDKSKVVVVYTLDETATEATTPFYQLESEAKTQGVAFWSRTEFERLRQE